MAVVAVYNLKGGVGKTTVAVNLAWAAAELGGLRTLIWDLDGQASATWILAGDRRNPSKGLDARSLLTGTATVDDLLMPTSVENLDLLPADRSLHDPDSTGTEVVRALGLGRALRALSKSHDCIVIDCPPGLGPTVSQVVREASIILLPMLPSTLSRLSLEEVQSQLPSGGKKIPPIVPVLTMVDMRRRVHRQTIENGPGYPIIPMASVIETMADHHAPVGRYAPRSAATQAFANLWYAVEPHL